MANDQDEFMLGEVYVWEEDYGEVRSEEISGAIFQYVHIMLGRIELLYFGFIRTRINQLIIMANNRLP